MPAILDIDLTAIAANYQFLKQLHAKKSAAAVVKADSYGLGMKEISKYLWDDGCDSFFVATLDEGITLRKILPEARIGIFNGLQAKEEKAFLHHKLLPVLNDISQIEKWEQHATGSPAILHIDTGMTRLGLNHSDLKHVVLRHHSFVTHSLAFAMSHLACAADIGHHKNADQLMRFNEALKLLPDVKASLSNSAALFFPQDFHFDIARPGCALYGINPHRGTENPMRGVVKLSAPILQIRTLDRDETIGYDSTFAAPKGSRIAVIGLGYADGWLRDFSNKGSAYINGHKVPVVGIVSMDMLELDVSAIAESEITSETRAEFINEKQTVDDVAKIAGTVGYEIFTRIGNRVERRYAGA